MSAVLPAPSFGVNGDLIVGHHGFKYKIEAGWGMLNSRRHPVLDCHEMVQDRFGRIILLTNHTKNNILIYNQKGKLLKHWGNVYPGAHGLTIKNEGGVDYLYITDTKRSVVVKTNLNGKEVLRITDPKRPNATGANRTFSPTETAVAENGDIYVADGYGSQYIYVFDQAGRLKFEFGGPGQGEDQFYNAHGIAIDQRDGDPKLLITAREKNQLKYFSLNGDYLSTIDLPGAYICRPVIHGENVYLATIWSGEKAENSGCICVLDAQNRLVSAPGAVEPTYPNGKLARIRQTLALFKHPHDVCVDQDENLYVPQWNAGQIYPMKLHRV